MAGIASRDRISAAVTKTYAAISGDVDLVTDRPGYAHGSPRLKPVWIHVGGTGALKLNYGNSITDTIPAVTAGTTFYIQGAAGIIDDGTDCTNITVGWP